MSTTDFERDISRATRAFEMERLRAEEQRSLRLLADAVDALGHFIGTDPLVVLEVLAASRGYNLAQAALLDDLERACDEAQGAEDFLSSYDHLERTRERMNGRRRIR